MQNKVEILIAKELEREELRSLQKEEAIRRMEKLGMLGDIVKYFKQSNKLYRSENFRFNVRDSSRFAIVYFLDRAEMKKVREWEEKTENLVYHVIKNKMEFGTCLSFLYVSNNPSDWPDDNEDLENYEDGSLYPLAYVMNIDDMHCSGCGTIGI